MNAEKIVEVTAGMVIQVYHNSYADRLPEFEGTVREVFDYLKDRPFDIDDLFVRVVVDINDLFVKVIDTKDKLPAKDFMVEARKLITADLIARSITRSMDDFIAGKLPYEPIQESVDEIMGLFS